MLVIQNHNTPQSPQKTRKEEGEKKKNIKTKRKKKVSNTDLVKNFYKEG
jgi:hypothetical protein